MDRTVVWTQIATQQLDAAAAYIRQDSSGYAASFVSEVLAAARSLRSMAERGRRVPEWTESGLRELVIGRYRLIYRVEDAGVFVVNLAHSGRDLRRLLAAEEP